jgi:hypothetical protein
MWLSIKLTLEQQAEQEERRRLETIIRNLKKEQANLSVKSGLSQHFTP